LTGKNIDGRKRSGGSMVRLADQAAEKIRCMIVEDLFSPWEPLSEFRLAQMLKISRTPVREAITQLEQEGLLKVVPGKGAFVIELTKEDFREINTLRAVLEPLAARTAVYFIPAEAVDEQKALWTRVAEELKAHGEVSAGALTEWDNQLHRLFMDYCDNSRLRNFLNVLRCQTMRSVHIAWETKAFMEETVGQHLEILQAVEEQNAQELCRALEKHIDFNNTVYASKKH
jgi:DNA-binding GntR family transcriptional regulator